MNRNGETHDPDEPHGVPVTATNVLRWTDDVLEISSDASKAQVQAAFLKRLQTVEFSPSEDIVTAFSFRASPWSHTAEEHAFDNRQVEYRLREAIDGFAERFFETEPSARTAEWTQLSDAAARFPALKRRLDRLQPGLSLPVATETEWNETRTAELAELWRKVFVATEPAAARLRQAAGESIRQHRREWLAAVGEFRQQSPDYERFYSGLLSWVSRGGSDTYPSQQRKHVVNVTVAKDAATSASESRPRSNAWVLVGVVCATLAVRLLGAGLRSDPTPSPKWASGPYSTPLPLDQSKTFRDGQQFNNPFEKNPRSMTLPSDLADRLKNTDDKELTPAELATKKIFDLGPKNPTTPPTSRPMPNVIPLPPNMSSRRTGPPISPSFGPQGFRSGPQVPRPGPSMPGNNPFPAPGAPPRFP